MSGCTRAQYSACSNSVFFIFVEICHYDVDIEIEMKVDIWELSIYRMKGIDGIVLILILNGICSDCFTF